MSKGKHPALVQLPRESCSALPSCRQRSEHANLPPDKTVFNCSVSRRSRCRSNCTWPFGWVSRWSYLNARLRAQQSILQIVSERKLTFWRVFWKAKSSSFVLVQKASFQAKNWQSYEKKKIGEANLRQRWDQPRQRWDQYKFLYIGRFSIFPGTWPNLFWVRQCDGETWKKRKERTKEKQSLWPKAKRRDFFNFSEGFVFGEGNRRLFTPGAKNFSCSRRRCSCVVRFACAWLNGQLGFERLSKSCTMSGTGKMAISFNSSFAWRGRESFCSLNEDRPIDGVGRPTIFVFHCARTQTRGAHHWGGKSACMAFFFLVWEQFLSFELIEEERKASKRQSSSDRWIEESRKKVIVSSFGVHA